MSLLDFYRARRQHANSDPYTEDELESLRQATAVGRSLRRRRRRKILPSLLKREAKS